MSSIPPSYDPSKFERPSVTVDILLFTVKDDALHVLLVERGEEPFRGMWALPGGFVRSDESLEQAALRELCEEAGIKDIYLEQLYTFGEPNRDPRTRVITVAYMALVPLPDTALIASGDALHAAWHPVALLPNLAFDHAAILAYGLERLRSKFRYSSIAYALLPESFRLSELQRVYEIILGTPLDKRNFRKWILSLNLLEATGNREQNGAHRPARLYRYKQPGLVLFN